MARSCSLVLTAAAALISATSLAGPQHWGSGYPYLISLEKANNGVRLVAYEAPLRAKNAVWIRRWIDTNPAYGKAPGPVAAGDFWPKPVGKEYVALSLPNGVVQFIDAPETFGTMRWGWVGKINVAQGPKQLVSGDLLGEKRDQLLAVTNNQIKIWSISGTPAAPSATLAQTVELPADLVGARVACGDFWGDSTEELALLNLKNEIRYMGLVEGKLKEIKRTRLPGNVGYTLGVDWVKDAFDSLTVLSSNGVAKVYAAPLKPGGKKNLGPNYTSKAMSRQWLPGTDADKLTANMSGSLETPGQLLGATTGRIFGYVNENTTTAVRKRNGIDDRPDAEISFTSRFPIHNLTEGAPHFGWPFKGEAYGYDIAVKNNGSTPIPAGSKLSVWLGVKPRNADVADATKDKPTFVFNIKQSIPPFNPLKPQYLKYRVEGKWPYDLIPCSPKASWKKANLEQVGERWLVCKLDAPNDRTLRNNRYEAALHSWTFHPIHREGNLADRKPTVLGDPCSFEYLHRKLADAIACVWERSGTTNNEDVLNRAYLDGYEFGYPSEVKPEKAMLAAWKKIQDKWEGWRELDIWTGENQRWEKYDWEYSPELHESCHLFHPLGDLYGNYVNPVWQKSVKMADGTPTQFQTNLWGPDLFGSGHALIGPNACELMKRYIVGSRGSGMDPWWTVAPAKVNVQVVDRNGKPVPGAEVTWQTDGKDPFVAKGTTDANGMWDIAPVFGKPSEPDKLGIVHHYGDGGHNVMDNNGMIFTVKIGDYVDAAIYGADDVNSHSRLTLFYQAMMNPDYGTWKIKTNYLPDAPKPDFSIVAAVKGSQVSMGINGPTSEYILYRRWEPAYIREKVLAFQGGKEAQAIFQDMAEADSHGKGRFRAIYEVTRVTPSGESLPKRISICGLKNAQGVTALKNGRLIVATNAGIANPFAMLFDGTIPAQEIFYHYRFGHTASKIVPSILVPEKYYLTLISSDVGDMDSRFDIAEPKFDRGGYDVRNDMHGFDCVSFSGTSPQTLILKDPAKAAELNPGDAIIVTEEKFVRVTGVDGVKVTTDKPVFASGATNLSFSACRLAGTVGDRLEFRELKNARSLACLAVGGKEYVALSDTGNNRVVVWNDRTKYLCNYSVPGYTPVSIVTDPRSTGTVWVLQRTSGGASVQMLNFDGTKLELVCEYPVVPGASSLALVLKPGTRGLFLAVCDPSEKRVVEYEVINENNMGGMVQRGVFADAIGVFAGEASLTNPVDLAYVSNGGAIMLYVIDGNDRLLRLK